jgi:hypothetical protein
VIVTVRGAMRKLGRLLSLPPRQQLLVARAAVLGLACDAGLRIVSLHSIARMLGVRTDFAPAASAAGALDDALLRRVRETAWAVDRALAQLPSETGPCLRRSLVLAHLLRDLRPSLRIGVGRRQGATYAHAWLEIAGARIGEPASGDASAAKPLVAHSRR